MANGLHSTRTLAVAALLAIMAGASATWAFIRSGADHEIRSVSLAHELEMTGICANALTLVEPTEGTKLSALLQQRLESSLRRSSSLVDSGARLGLAAPDLEESARRAVAFYERRNETERKREAERLLEKLTEAR